MTLFGIGTLAYRFTALFVVTRSLPNLVRHLTLDFDQLDVLVGEVLILAFAALVWVNAPWLARKTLDEPSHREAVVADEGIKLFQIGIRLVGLWLLASLGIPGFIFTLVNYVASENAYGSSNDFLTWWHLIPSVVQITLGVWLLVAPGGIESWIRKSKAPEEPGA